MKLYSYCLRVDDGAAPNPFWGLCTLVICKPVIRRKAEIGDWVVGLGSANSPVGNISNSVVYAMKVTGKMTLAEYDAFCISHYPNKIPQWGTAKDRKLWFGDCIYDYSVDEPPEQRRGVHRAENKETDLRGRYALLSERFFYFGNKPCPLPLELHPIIHPTQGHKSDANQPHVADFVHWIEGLKLEPNILHGLPQTGTIESEENEEEIQRRCSVMRLKDDKLDEAIDKYGDH